jgi:hypothetical protein
MVVVVVVAELPSPYKLWMAPGQCGCQPQLCGLAGVWARPLACPCCITMYRTKVVLEFSSEGLPVKNQ